MTASFRTGRARALVAAAALVCAAGDLSAQGPSPTLRSAVEGRRVMDDVFAAVGGREAIRSVRSIETEETIRQTNGRLGLRPSAPTTVYGRRIASVDVPGQRIAELRILDLWGNQLADVGRFITPTASTVVNWSNMTRDSIPQAKVPQARAGFARRHFLPFLQSFERQPVTTTRWLGITTVNGTPHDAVSVTDAGGTLLTLLVDRQTHLPSRVELLVVGSAVGDSVDVLQFSDYRRVGALLLPHRRSAKRVPDVEWEYRTLRFELDTPIADSVFTVPSGHGEPGTAADLDKSLRRGQARAQCPTGTERRQPCNLDAPTPQPTSSGFSVREIPTRPEGDLAQPAIVIPPPGGPHRVGRMTFHAVDSLRKEVMTPDPADFRELVFHVWYPSDAIAGTRASYINGALQDSVFRRVVSFADTMARVRSSALMDVTVSDAARQYPVILFSHGLGTLSQTYTSFIENLASHGYVVVGADHAYYSAPYTLPDGRTVRNLSRNEDRQRDVVAQAEDLSFLVNVLGRLNEPSGSSPTRLAGRLDLGQLGVFGHSRGGFASPHACRRDLRFKACANLDGYSMTPAVMDSGIGQPFMLVEEIAPWDPPPTDSQLLQFRWTRAQADSAALADSSRREATFSRMAGGAYIVVSPGAVHNSFSDFGVIVPGRFPLARQAFRRTLEITNAYVLAFFDTYLRGRSPALLKGKSDQYPEAWLTVYRPGAVKRVFPGAPTWERPDRRR